MHTQEVWNVGAGVSGASEIESNLRKKLISTRIKGGLEGIWGRAMNLKLHARSRL